MSFIDHLRKFAGADGEADGDDNNYETIIDMNKDHAEEHAAGKEKKDKNYMNINTTAQLQVVLVKPEEFEDAREIADNLISKRTVLLNIENLNKDLSRRLIDFLSGVAYAQGGNIKRVANRTYIITPYNVDILGDVLDGINPDSFEF